MNCQDCQTALPDLLLDPASSAARRAQLHLNDCSTCREELTSLEATFNLLDDWTAPEPTPWFDQKLAARLREVQAAPPEGFFERLRSRLLFGTDRQLRPALAGGLALALIIGGGTAATLTGLLHNRNDQVSAAVQDLQILDRNDQAFQTMDQLLQDDGQPDDNSSDSPAS